MKITQIRNATFILTYGKHNILIDPMLSKKGSLPRLRLLGGKGLNPLVELPIEFEDLSEKVDLALITHCQKGHFDHLDRKGISFLKRKHIPVFAHEKDQAHLQKWGLSVRPLSKHGKNSFLGGTIELVNARHGIGGISFLMEHGVGFYIELPGAPSIYVMGDTVLTREIRAFIRERQPAYIVAPTGVAMFDIGGPILLSEAEIVELSQLAKGKIIANHMDTLDHCRLTRNDLKKLMARYSLDNILIPNDGESLEL